MSLARKLNVKEGMRVRVIGKPAGLDLGDVPVTTAVGAEAVLAFVRTRADVDAKAAPVLAAAREDRIAWLAYPKAGQLDTDLNRDLLVAHVRMHGVQGVRLVAIDATWSAMRFRPA